MPGRWRLDCAAPSPPARSRSGSGLTMARKIRTLAEEENYVSLNMPPIERRSLMEMGMRRKTTHLDIVVVAVFFGALLALLGYFLVPVLATLVSHIPDLFTNTGH